MLAHSFLIESSSLIAGNQDRHKSSDEFDFGPLVSMAHLYVFLNEIWPWHIGLRWAIVALWATCWINWVLAHLSRRLTRWAYSIPMVRCQSVVVIRCRRASSSVIAHSFKLEYLWRQLVNLDQILCVASLGWGKGCIRFLGRLDQNSGFQGNRKPPLTFNGENDVSTFSRLFLIRSFLYLQVTKTCIKSGTSSNFGKIGPPTTELAALSVWKISHRLIMGNAVYMLARSFLIESSSKLLVTRTGIKASDEFDFGLDQTTHFWVTCPWIMTILHFRTWISLRPGGQSWSNFMCSITRGGKRLHNVLRQIRSKLWCPWQQKAPIDL